METSEGAVLANIRSLMVAKSWTVVQCFQAFDQDRDGFISLEDLKAACATLGIQVSTQEIESFHGKFKGGLLSMEAWTETLGEGLPKENDVSRGSSNPKESAPSNVREDGFPTPPSVQLALDLIAASLAYNNLSPEDGYDAFDVDEDGKVSLDDLTSAVASLNLQLENEGIRAAFAHLDHENTGFIDKDVWGRAIHASN